MTMMISKLPIDLVEEILSRVPLKSIGAVRSTCKKWNALSKDESFRDKHISKTSRGKEFLMNTRDHRVYLINVNHYKTHVNKFDLSVKRKGTLMTRENSVWNPYLCKRRWIKWPSGRFEEDQIAFGYDKSSCGSFKILMFCYTYNQYDTINQFVIYDSNSNSWRVTDVPDETLDSFGVFLGIFGVSLKGDYYSYARDQESHGFLRCFDFTRERFGPRLPLPVDPSIVHGVSLSTVREEQLGLLVNRSDTYKMEVGLPIKLSRMLSWTNFFKVDMNSVGRYIGSGSLYIVEEENMVVVFGGRKRMFRTCIVGENGYFTKKDLRKCIDIHLEPFVASYVPTSAQIM